MQSNNNQSILFRQPSGVIKYSRWLLFLTTIFICLLLTGSGVRGVYKANRVAREIVQTRAKDILAGVRRRLGVYRKPENNTGQSSPFSTELLEELHQDMKKQGLTYLAGISINEAEKKIKINTSSGSTVMPVSDINKLKGIKNRELIISKELKRAQIIEKVVLRNCRQHNNKRFRANRPSFNNRPPQLQQGGSSVKQQPLPQYIVIEFKPTMSLAIVHHAKTNLILGLLATFLFALANLLLWRLSLREEKLASKISEETSLKKLGEMSAILGHEIKNPLASLKGHSQLLARKLDGDERQKKANLIVKEAKRIELLTGQILDFAKSGKLSITKCDIGSTISNICKRFPEERITLDVKGCPFTWALDETKIDQVLTNIIRNGLQASEPTGTVSISGTVSNRILTIKIKDDGPGIHETELDTIFEPFKTNSLQGTGLGLAVAKRIVEGHNGKITAGNNTDKGAFFRIEIPKGNVNQG